MQSLLLRTRLGTWTKPVRLPAPFLWCKITSTGWFPNSLRFHSPALSQEYSHPKSPLLPSNRVSVNEPHQGWEDEIRPERKILGAFHPVLRGHWICTRVAKFHPLGCAQLQGKIRRGGDIHSSELWSCCGTGAITVIKNIYS